MMQTVAKTTTPCVVGRSNPSIAWMAVLPRPGRPKTDSVKIAPCDRRGGGPPQAGGAKTGFGKDPPPGREADVHAEHRHDRQQRVAQPVGGEDEPLRRTLRAGRADVVLPERLHRVRADHADV